MEVGGYRKMRRLKQRWSEVIRRHEFETSQHRRSTIPENLEIENMMRQPQIGKRPNYKKKLDKYFVIVLLQLV